MNHREQEAKKKADAEIDAAAARIVKTLKEIRAEQKKETAK